MSGKEGIMFQGIKKYRAMMAIAFSVQSVTSFVMSLMFFFKKRSFSRAFFTVASLTGVIAVMLLTLQKLEDTEKKRKHYYIPEDDLSDEPVGIEDDEMPEHYTIPVDDTVCEDEFSGV